MVNPAITCMHGENNMTNKNRKCSPRGSSGSSGGSSGGDSSGGGSGGGSRVVVVVVVAVVAYLYKNYFSE